MNTLFKEKEHQKWAISPREVILKGRDENIISIQVSMVYNFNDWSIRVKCTSSNKATISSVRVSTPDDPAYVSMVYSCTINELERNLHKFSMGIGDDPNYTLKEMSDVLYDILPSTNNQYLEFIMKGITLSKNTISFTREQLEEYKKL